MADKLSPAETYKAMVAEIRAGRNISAVRLAIDNFAMRLGEAKALVEAIIDEHYDWVKNSSDKGV